MSGKRLLPIVLGVALFVLAPLAHGSGLAKRSNAQPLIALDGEVTGSYVLTSNGLEATLVNKSSQTFFYNAGKLADGRAVSGATFNGTPCTSSIPPGWSFDCGPYEFGPGQTAKLDVTVAGLNGLRESGAVPIPPALLAWFSNNKIDYCCMANIPPSTPPPPPPPPPPTTPGEPKPCDCSNIRAAVDPTLLSKKGVPARKHNFGISFSWTMTCTAGKGNCAGEIDILPVKVLAGKLPSQRGALKLSVEDLTISCAGVCGTSNKGKFQIQMRSPSTLNHLYGRAIAFQLELFCLVGGERVQKGTVPMKFQVDQKGKLTLAP